MIDVRDVCHNRNDLSVLSCRIPPIVNRLETDKYVKLKVKAEIIELNSSITLLGIYSNYTCCSLVMQVFLLTVISTEENKETGVVQRSRP
jgi:hypothetical protein